MRIEYSPAVVLAFPAKQALRLHQIVLMFWGFLANAVASKETLTMYLRMDGQSAFVECGIRRLVMYDGTTLSKRYFTISGKSHELPFTSISCPMRGALRPISSSGSVTSSGRLA